MLAIALAMRPLRGRSRLKSLLQYKYGRRSRNGSRRDAAPTVHSAADPQGGSAAAATPVRDGRVCCCSADSRRQGCRREAPRDGFTACPTNSSSLARPCYSRSGNIGKNHGYCHAAAARPIATEVAPTCLLSPWACGRCAADSRLKSLLHTAFGFEQAVGFCQRLYEFDRRLR